MTLRAPGSDGPSPLAAAESSASGAAPGALNEGGAVIIDCHRLSSIGMPNPYDEQDIPAGWGVMAGQPSSTRLAQVAGRDAGAPLSVVRGVGGVCVCVGFKPRGWWTGGAWESQIPI